MAQPSFFQQLTELAKLTEPKVKTKLVERISNAMTFGSSSFHETSDQKLIHDVNEVCDNIGVPHPIVRIVDSKVPQAAASKNGYIYISTALLKYPTAERNAIIAHEAAHLWQLAHKSEIPKPFWNDKSYLESDADKRGARATSPEAMAAALRHVGNDVNALPPLVNKMNKIILSVPGVLKLEDEITDIFSSHKSVDTRIHDVMSQKGDQKSR